jgi:hypothetical protein
MPGSNSIFTALAWSVVPEQTVLYPGFITRAFPPVYPTVVLRMPLPCNGRKCLRKMCSTPQKHPPAKVVISRWAVAAVGLVSVG